MTTSGPVPARRGSLVGPLILVLLGVAFLVSNLRPDFSLWRLMVRYWPLLLIFWGLARLVEYGIARMTDRPIARTLTGGEVFLAIVICVFGSAASGWESWDWRPWRMTRRGLEVLGESHEFPMQASREVPKDATVVIQNWYGNARIAGGAANEIRITGRKSVRAFGREAAEADDKQTPLEIVEEKGRIVVRTNQDRLPGERRTSVDLEVTLPATAALKLEGRYGDFEIRDMAAPVEVDSRNAGVRASNLAKNLRVNLGRSDIVRAAQIKGDIEITGRGSDIEVEKVGGSVTVQGEFAGVIKMQDVAKAVRYSSSRTDLTFERLPGRLELDGRSLSIDDVVGPLKLVEPASRQRGSRDIRIDGFTKELDISARQGNIDLRAAKLPLASIKVETRSGDIELSLPPNAVFGVLATSQRGTAESEFDHTVKVDERGKNRAAEIRGGPAGAAAQVRLSTERGDVRLKKAG